MQPHLPRSTTFRSGKLIKRNSTASGVDMPTLVLRTLIIVGQVNIYTGPRHVAVFHSSRHAGLAAFAHLRSLLGSRFPRAER